ncbi:MAG: hypothetical protein LDLANPLL_00347 [Turneriella sp.]|nr:hypothetical protein [Turneriella sp.]
MKKWILLGVIALFVPLYANNIGGTYSVAGQNPDGSSYYGTVFIASDGSSGYTVNWTIGESQYSGVGKLKGKILVVDWGQPDPVVYKILPNGTLQGKWGPGGKGSETLTPQM